MAPSIYNRILNDVKAVAFNVGGSSPYEMNRITTEDRNDALTQMRGHINSLKEVSRVTDMLIKASRQRIVDLESQRSGASKELDESKAQLAVPMKRELSIEDMVDFYKKKLNITDNKREKIMGRVDELSNVINNIDIEIVKAKEEEKALIESSAKLQNDISAMENSLEQERTEKVTVMAKYEKERQDILKKQEEDARQSAGKVATLQQKLQQAQAMTEQIVKKHESQGYEKKISAMQSELQMMNSKLSQTQTDLTEKLNNSQKALKAALSMNQEGDNKISDYERMLKVYEMKVKVAEEETKKKMKDIEEREKKYSASIDNLNRKIQDKDKRLNTLEKEILIEGHKTETIKRTLESRKKIIESNELKISSLEREIKSLQLEMARKEKEAEGKLANLKVEMVRKTTEAEVQAAAQVQMSKEKIEMMSKENDLAIAKKNRMIAALKNEGEHIKKMQQENEHMFNTRLDMMKEQMAIKLREAEAAATNALEAATRQLHAVRSEREKSLAEKDNIICYLEGKRDKNLMNMDDSSVSTSNSSVRTSSSKSSRSYRLRSIVSKVSSKLSAAE
uniref:Uncharacterized protein n=1 Tax=Corethron hystrix TaxID=216773 RepID=A0A7S1BGH7_9STRA|mmetsp:Transcript_25205/g.58230  ORF Transcript_25205/g.58230 Transcript_25205/m.58230 type:complete len:565 (+) Transcript_25205:197-1891(+)|eukprot:CAMPEP_0113315132 /NCGR_PEP_ID=MMETSP0010_2-20120614/10923_1 /TAXON_ID=216773 ORGANISM="Corethron hystrix, Strain 308" /NCGR_SAMPLE_ID=MMETSP0010_2 /ASSEMBLY_ACC=CAM_ASM_000155 /LENGTH=564 /DNA_ID=CAMNT_0000171573 /DNA_START=58 /DNA_END=1752 /DNA_ORIENTATION=+ /assembly_acc=CAM_ASM_000155